MIGVFHVQTAFLAAGDDAIPVITGGTRLCRRHVFAERDGQEREILKDHREDGQVLFVFVLSNVDPVEEDLPLRRIVQTAEQLDKGCFAGAVLSDHRHPFADPKYHGQMPQRPILRAGIAEGYVPELHFVVHVSAFAENPLFHGKRPLVERIRQVDIGESVRKIVVVTDDGIPPVRDPLQRFGEIDERARVQHEIADADIAVMDLQSDVRIEYQRRDEISEVRRELRGPLDPCLFPVEFRADVVLPHFLHNDRTETEDADVHPVISLVVILP